MTFKRKHGDIKKNYEKNAIYVFYSKSLWCYLSLLLRLLCFTSFYFISFYFSSLHFISLYFKFLFNYKYVLDNEDNGKTSTLDSKKVRCSILFAVFVSDKDNEYHDMTFGKKALADKCQCDRKVKGAFWLEFKKQLHFFYGL